ncbi:hypothetical protein [Ewingella americana]
MGQIGREPRGSCHGFQVQTNSGMGLHVSQVSKVEYGVESAFSFWVSKGLDKTAKNLGVKAVTQKVNGGQNGFDDRQKRYNELASLLTINKDE